MLKWWNLFFCLSERD